MDLFDQQINEYLEKNAPLAYRLRPKKIEDFIGQNEIIGPGRILRRAIEQDLIQSAIFWGPPGSGKTTLAEIIANITKKHFVKLSAVSSDIAEVRRVISGAKDRNIMDNLGTVVFIDEIHRFNKNQQDALLPAVEEGLITLIGATTENPFFEVNAPLLSRSRIFQFKPLNKEEINQIYTRALTDKEKGLKKYNLKIEKKAKEHLLNSANGDARLLLNALEFLAIAVEEGKNKERNVSIEEAEEAVQKRYVAYDKSGDDHYDTISAFIKSIRGSDPDAAVFWLSKMLYAGEDPKIIARRLIISASEDIGLADSNALNIAVSAAQAVDFVGLPEARINLAQATIYLALAPKSNSSYLAIKKAFDDVEKKHAIEVPDRLKDSSYKGAKFIGHGQGYLYPHDYENHYIDQEYLPSNLKDARYYQPTAEGEEKIKVSQWLKRKNVENKKQRSEKKG